MTESAATGSPGATFALPSSGGAVVWRRFRRDRVAVCALGGLALIAVACFVVEPLLELVLGHGPDEPFPAAVRPWDHRPVGWFSLVAGVFALLSVVFLPMFVYWLWIVLVSLLLVRVPTAPAAAVTDVT